MPSAVDICNMALARIGVRRFISALTDPSDNAAACKQLVPMCRDRGVASFPFPFAEKRATLALLPTTRDGYAYMYQAPADMLVARYIWAGIRNPYPDQKIPFTLEASDDNTSTVLLTDQPNAELVYTSQVPATNSCPPLVADAIAWALAVELSMALRVDAAVRRDAENKAKESLMLAGAVGLSEFHEAEPQAESIAARGDNLAQSPTGFGPGGWPYYWYP